MPPLTQPDSVVDAPFLQGGGRVGALMRAHDWSRSPLGAPAAWPQALRTVVDLLLHSQFPMFVAWGSELGFLYNDAYAEILGAKHPRSLGARFHDIWAEIWDDIHPLIEAAMAGQASYHEDLPLVMNRKGYDEQTWFTFSYSPVRGDRGGVEGMFCAVWETTPRVLAENALRELNETLERRVDAALAERRVLADIVEGTDAFVQVADLDYRWLAINQSAAREFERIYGVRPRVGTSMLELLADQPAHQAAVRSVWSRALAGEEFVEIAEFGDPARDRRFYEMRYNTLRGPGGERIGAYQFVYDVSERHRDQERLRRAEEALRHTQKMESLGQLTGGVAHDFNNLLAVFANGLQVLERDVSPEQRQRVYASMRRAVTRGSGLTHQLLSFSRRRPLHPESVDLAASLEGMRDMLARPLRSDIEIRMEIAPDLWPVEIDAGEFELALLNLCVNARDAMTAAGTITIAARNSVEIGDNGAAQNFVRLSVSDTGSGMPPEVLARIFEPFFTTKDVGKGSGLGLPQVYGFVQQSGGRLTVDSQVGAGTVVTVLLPRALHEPAAASSAPVVADVTRAGGNVLLVEDDLEVAALTREMLSELGFTVLHAASPAAALGALANGRAVDVVFSDIMMPGPMNGLELAREIRRRQPGLPVVLTTGYSEATASMRGDEFRVLLKPYSVEALRKALGD
ncbi:PAS domain-containing protein [Ramlibacter sp. XY19]|uniref:PAS domain-containing protein n=1 Tax=Ramlibacter paludis TaxID=2908000 RepID=UPI0023DCCC28|nr:PAS domain-containing protein [Ramlibacter paludis]MCG2594457.1 PAS domain-containing protein [Ramlibacter paludis]